MVSSSSPSSPRNSSTSVGRRRPAREHLGHHRRHPRVAAADRAGGRLRRVGQRAEEVEDRRDAQFPARRTGVPERRVDTPARSRTRCRPRRRWRRPPSAGSEIATPSPSSRSAAPHLLDAARLPCLTTGAPAPAITIAAIVEMFTVFARSPPVPTMSTARTGTVTRTACASMLSTRPATSAARLALGPQRDREAGHLRRGGLAGHDAGPSPRRCPRRPGARRRAAGSAVPGQERLPLT